MGAMAADLRRRLMPAIAGHDRAFTGDRYRDALRREITATN
jgi:hypothetical protein